MAKIVKIQFESLQAYSLNVRDVTDGSDLVQSLLQRGLDVPLKVRKMEDGMYVVLCGNRRLDGITKLMLLYPEAFQQWFSKGVNCEVFEGITDEEALAIMADHGDICALKSGMEFYRLAKAKWSFQPEYTEKQILGFIGSALANSLEGKALIEVTALTNAVNTATNVMDKATRMLERNERLFTACKGKLQTWNAIRRCPPLAEKLLAYTYTGVKPAGVAEDLLITVSQSQADEMRNQWLALPVEERSDAAFEKIVRSVNAAIKAKKAERDQKKADKENMSKAVAEQNANYYLAVVNWIAEKYPEIHKAACDAVFAEANK